ncbi:MAG: hypothetical protein RJA97_1119 [Bacteroidota bacterium]
MVLSSLEYTQMNQITRLSALFMMLSAHTTLSAQCNPLVQFTLSPPNVTTSAVQGQSGSLTEDFNTQSVSSLPLSGTLANGSYTTMGNVQVKPDDVWGGSGSQYLQINGSNALVNLSLTNASRYVGFWWGAGDPANKLKLYAQCGGTEVKLAEFTTADVLSLLSATNVVANDGVSYLSSTYRRSNAGNEPFAYINVQLNDSNYFFTRIEVGGGGFELDNLTTSAVYGAGTGTVPTAPTLVSAAATGTAVDMSFVRPYFNGGTPIVNYEYSIDSGTTWIGIAPADTISPLTFNSIFGGLFQLQIRAINGIGSGAGSNILAFQMGQEELGLLNFEVAPNPASTSIQLFRRGQTPRVQSMELVDSSGKIIQSFDGRVEGPQSLSGVPKGTYWLVIKTDAGILKQPLVVQ